MRLGSFNYLVKQGAKNTYLNKAMSFASVSVLTACLAIVGFAILFSNNVNKILGYVQQQNEIVVYLDDDLSAEEETTIDRQIRSMDNVASVTYVSKEQAFKDQQDKLGTLLEGYENEDVFPASYSIKVKDLELLDKNVKELNKIEGLYKVDAPTDIAATIIKTNKGISLVCTALIIVLLVVSLVIIINTIKITVYNRRTEIGIMKNVGATNNFVRLPFLIEGMILGAISGIVAFLIVWYLYEQAAAMITENFTGWVGSVSSMIIPFGNVAWWLVMLYILLGMAIGGVGSTLSIRKHLKV